MGDEKGQRWMKASWKQEGRNMDENLVLELPQKHLRLPIEQQEETKRTKLTPAFSDLDDDQLMAIFGESLRFVVCRVVLFREHYADPPLSSLGLFRQQLLVSYQIRCYNRIVHPIYSTVNSIIPYTSPPRQLN